MGRDKNRKQPPSGQMNPPSPGAAEVSGLLQRADLERSRGNLPQARAICQNITERWPDHADTFHYLGLLDAALGDPEAALKHFRRSVELSPGNPRYHANIGLFHYQNRCPDLAEASFKQALRIDPHAILALVQLGNLYFESRRPEQARDLYQKAISLKPDLPVAQYNLGSLLQDEGNLDQALRCYDKVRACAPNDGLTIRRETALPVIIASHQDLLEARARYARKLAELGSGRLTVKDPVREVGQTGFYLAYHGLNDRPLQERLAALYEQSVPGINYVSPHCINFSPATGERKLRIGFISEFFRAQTVGVVIEGIINRIDRGTFDVSVFHFPRPDDDEITRHLKNGADSWVELTGSLEEARAAIEQQKLDILVYADIGMTATTYFLAFSRLAPVQCVTWGHPVTTGIRNMDYYISCEDFEPEGADAHYSEQLVRLKNPPTYYQRPKFPGNAGSRADYGLEEEATIYVCVQNLFKFHPDFDEVIGEILKADPDGRLVFMHGSRARWGELLMDRFKKSIPDVVGRISLLPRQPFPQYLNLLKLADVALDTLHFGGGSTTYQCLAAGLPVVTLPGNFMRSRFTYACYKRMGLMDCVAENKEDYVRIATRLGTDKAWRRKLSDSILSSSDILYEDDGAVREFERFFTSVKPRIK